VKSRDYGNISYYKTIFFYYIAKFPFFKTDTWQNVSQCATVFLGFFWKLTFISTCTWLDQLTVSLLSTRIDGTVHQVHSDSNDLKVDKLSTESSKRKSKKKKLYGENKRYL